MNDQRGAGPKITNGVNVTELGEVAQELGRRPELGAFRFRVQNEWSGEGGLSASAVEPFHGLGQEQQHREDHHMVADEPEALLGEDRGANPVEHLLGALASCLTGAMVYHAAARGIELRRVASRVEGDLDVRGFMGVTPGVPKGYQRIAVEFEVDADATPEQLRQLAEFSPVLNTLRDGVPIELRIHTRG